jgi:hypothetical protein
MAQWCYWTCALPSIERNIDTILQENPPRRIRADTLARHLHVSDAERTFLRVYTIGAYDVPKAARMKRRKERRRLAAQARRRAKGAKPREQSLTQTKPWLKDGIGERHWRRRNARMSEIRSHESCLKPRLRISDIEHGPAARAIRGKATAKARNDTGRRPQARGCPTNNTTRGMRG